jgi:hypothetical protein
MQTIMSVCTQYSKTFNITNNFVVLQKSRIVCTHSFYKYIVHTLIMSVRSMYLDLTYMSLALLINMCTNIIFQCEIGIQENI